jgi:hypothetical protein
MISSRERLARFIQSEGHRASMTLPEDDESAAEIVFRTRGYAVSVVVWEGNPPQFEVVTAFEIPEWATERAQTADILHDAARDEGMHFQQSGDGKTFAAVLDCGAMPLETFQEQFWPAVTKVRNAGVAALERVLDRSESKAAADKFIRSLQRGD